MAGDLPPSSSVTGTRFAGRLHDGSSDGGASGEDEMIERQGGERGTIALTIVTCSSGKIPLIIDASTAFVAGRTSTV
jgi:hypothetical protein